MMRLTEEQYEVNRPLMPVQRGNVRIANLDVTAVLYVAENGCKWRALPERFGNGHTIYTRLRRWAEAGVLDRRFRAWQDHRLIRIRVACGGLDSTSVKVHPDGTGARKKTRPQAIGKSCGGGNTKLHLVAADDRIALTFALSPGQAHDAPEGRKLRMSWQRRPDGVPRVRDRAEDGDQTRQRVLELGFEPVVPPNPTASTPGPPTAASIAGRNEIERLFRRLNGFRRIVSRFEKLLFAAFIDFALIIDMICVNTP